MDSFLTDWMKRGLMAEEPPAALATVFRNLKLRVLLFVDNEPVFLQEVTWYLYFIRGIREVMWSMNGWHQDCTTAAFSLRVVLGVD